MPVVPGNTPQPRFVPLSTHLELTAGDDSKLADGTGLMWESSKWPNLASATLKMTVGHMQYNLYGDLPIYFTGSVPQFPNNPSTISLDVPGSDTENLPQDEYDYQLDATLVNGDTITIAIGHLTVSAPPGTVPLYPPAV